MKKVKKTAKKVSANLKKSLKPKVKYQRETMKSSMSKIKKTADKWIDHAGMTKELNK